jgi:DNA modification methylase
VAFIEASDEADARKKLLAISSQYGEFDASELSEWLDEIGGEVAETLRLVDTEIPIGVASEEKEVKDAEPQVDKAEELNKKWQVKQGDVWQLGDHRLMCGDSTKPSDVEILMGGALADMIFTDPPYGVSYVGTNSPNGKDWQMIKNDDLRGDGLYDFLLVAFKNLFEQALNQAGFTVKQQLIWNKGMVLGHSDYHWAHEPVLYCKKTDQSTSWYGDRTGKTMLRARRSELNNLKKEDLVQILKNMMDESSVWEIDRDQAVKYQHPTQKPVTLAIRALCNSSQPENIVLDLFSGSGSTLIACENTERVCYGMELDPKYCAVILQRYFDVTGNNPKKVV